MSAQNVPTPYAHQDKTREQALRDLGQVIADELREIRQLTPRQAAERAWHPDHRMSLDELTDHCASLGICREPGEL